MSYYNSTMSDLEYYDIMNFECPYDHNCNGCEYDCGDDEL